MPVLSNARHERFAQELAKGKSATEAYELAGFKPNRHNGAALARQEHILTRCAEIQYERAAIEREATAQAAEALSIDKQWVMAKLIHNAEKAATTGDFSPSNKALELLGKELGMFIDRKNLNVTGDLGKLTDAELLAFLEEADEDDDQAGIATAPGGPGVTH